MPTTIHRWYIWHITKKIPSKLNGYKGHAEIEQELSQVVWNSHSKDSFDRNWNDFLLKYGLVDNKWLLDFHTAIPCATKSSIEAQFQHVYTHQKFREVQAQFRGKENCITRLTNSALGYLVYEVGEQVFSSIFNKFVVTYNSVAAQVKCQCLLFASRGILCRHALSVLSFERVTQVSLRYILERWSKKVKRRHTHQEQPRRATVGAKKQEGTCLLSHENVNLESVNELQSPLRVQTRGRPKNRLGSKLDKQIANASKKKKTKALNELNLFDAASVVRLNSSQYQGHVMNYQFKEPAAGHSFLGV
ncbi:hypothetical protein Ahy_B04g069391 [Arachis hypogaea]|uniref:Protein FAR1-RELATED SEQUENCE n=1 Tax=Arachis hypogaea TaxID=3818 RepID=A0A444ZCF7_ARAHY|nr:hypothetical protein Ahy_B04g069391 [Arachis hypogaea]